MSQAIVKEKTIPVSGVKKMEDTDFELALPQLLVHLKQGDIKKGKSIGIHFFDHGLHRVCERIKPANAQGIWEAKIAVRHPNTNAWVPKEKSSTLFPIHWTAQVLSTKLREAFHNAKRVTAYKQLGKTACGISIVFIFQQKKLSSCYPVWE
jgi:hypothetical protein